MLWYIVVLIPIHPIQIPWFSRKLRTGEQLCVSTFWKNTPPRLGWTSGATVCGSQMKPLRFTEFCQDKDEVQPVPEFAGVFQILGMDQNLRPRGPGILVIFCTTQHSGRSQFWPISIFPHWDLCSWCVSAGVNCSCHMIENVHHWYYRAKVMCVGGTQRIQWVWRKSLGYLGISWNRCAFKAPT